jgi:hypothetical protein
VDCRARSGRPRPRIENAHTAWVQDFAASAVSPSIDSAGTGICGMPGQTRTRYGIVPASLPGSSGTQRTVRQPPCGASKAGAAAKQADGYGRMLRSITVFRFFGCGANIENCVGRSCSTFGACQTFKSLIATPTLQNAPSRRGTDEPHARLKLNRANREHALAHV